MNDPRDHALEPPAPRIPGAGALLRNQRGIGLSEVLAGTIVATLAVVGLAYSFGVGRGLIDRYAVARQALGRAQLVVDSLVTVPRTSLTDANQPFWIRNSDAPAGTTAWTIVWVDDPADGLGGTDPDRNDLRRITVTVSWSLGGASDQLSLSRMVSAN